MLKPSIFQKVISFIISLLLLAIPCYTLANNPVVNLVISYKTVNFAGKPVQAIAVNGQIPGPTLHFKEGDHVTINVYNHLKQGTTIHWHGLIVPWQMDGVAGVSQKSIPPGGVFHYQFTLHQSGTYWYHAHDQMEEQQGLYGGIIIDPSHPPAYHYDKDYVVVLSDWSNTDPNMIYANLKKAGDYYSTQFPLQPSLARFIHNYISATTSADRKQLVNTYFMSEKMNMSPYDISDVAYDAFLLNGHTTSSPWQAPVKVGDIVRLRIIDAGGSSFFNIKIPGTIMQVVHVQGNDVRPYTLKELTIAPAETYDVLVKITHNTPTIIYAESADTLGIAYGALVTQPDQTVNYKAVKPFPLPAPSMTMAHDMSNMNGMDSKMANMPGMSHANTGHNMLNMKMSNQPTMSATENYKTTPGTKYQNMEAITKTNDPNIPVHVEVMTLAGNMNSYTWLINGIPEYEAKPIVFVPGQRYRFVFINDTMMHHPMHLHGHWFILRNGHGAYDPLLHTIDVPPGATIVVDVDADTSGQWYFHCHNIYHMMAGMANRVVYAPATATTTTTNSSSYAPMSMSSHSSHNAATAINPEIPDYLTGEHSNHLSFVTELDIDSNFYNTATLTYKGLYGTDNNKLELFTNDAEMVNSQIENADMDIFYWHAVSQSWAIKGGLNYVLKPASYVQPGIGLEGMLPFFIETDARSYYHDGSFKLDLELTRNTQLISKLFLETSVRAIVASKTVDSAEIGSGLNETQIEIGPRWQFSPALAFYTVFESTNNYGETKTLLLENGEDVHENIVKAGVSLLL